MKILCFFKSKLNVKSQRGLIRHINLNFNNDIIKKDDHEPSTNNYKTNMKKKNQSSGYYLYNNFDSFSLFGIENES